MKIEIDLPPHVKPDEAARVKEVLEGQLASNWELFKSNASAFFSSLKILLGDIWNKIASWASNLWDKLFG